MEGRLIDFPAGDQDAACPNQNELIIGLIGLSVSQIKRSLSSVPLGRLSGSIFAYFITDNFYKTLDEHSRQT